MWWRKGEARYWVLEYLRELRVLRRRSGFRGWCTCCEACGVPFVAHPRNRGRTDLCCPFGCRQARRKSWAAARCKEYRGTRKGQDTKHELYVERARRMRAGEATAPPRDDAASQDVPDAPLLTYVWMLACWIEQRHVTLAEVRRLLLGFRQRSMDLASSPRQILRRRLKAMPP